MNKNRYALIIDGNYFLFRTLYTLPKQKGSTDKLLATQDEADAYVRKLATDLAYQVRLFSDIVDTVIWTLDSRSWRKDFYPQAEYKGNRTQDSSINWELFSSSTEEFKSILSKHGVVISKVDGAEGDDLIYAWNSHFTFTGKSTIILTGDRDMVQLVGKHESTSAHTLFYTPAHGKLYAYPGFTSWLNESSASDDFFSAVRTYGMDEDHIKKSIALVIKKKKLAVLEQDPEEFIFKKMLTGDKGDNVMPAYWRIQTTKSGKECLMGISEAKADKIWSSFCLKHGGFSSLYLFSDDYVNSIVSILIKEIKVKTMSREQIAANIKRNTSLMLLSSKTIPEELLDEAYQIIESAQLVPISAKALSSMKDMLAGSRYIDEGSSTTAITSSFFSGEKAADDMSFITDRKTKKSLF